MCIWKVSEEDRHCNMCLVMNCADRPRRARRHGLVMGKLRNMEVEGVIELPLENYGRARTAASKLKSEFGAVFETHKVGDMVVIRRKS